MEERKHQIIVNDASGRLTPEDLAKFHAALLEADLQVVVGKPNTEETREGIIKMVDESLMYPAPLFQNREARRKAAKEEKRKNRRMF